MNTSIVFVYHNRPIQLKNTIDSYNLFYTGKEGIEIVAVDDSSTDPDVLLRILKENLKIPYIHKYIDRKHIPLRNPCKVYNEAVKLATYENIIITNPENAHANDIVSHVENNLTPNSYLVYGTKTVKCPESFADLLEFERKYIIPDDPDAVKGWYQHSKYNNRMLHFLTAIKKKDFLRIGGFDENYDKGYAVDDDDLICTILNAKFQIKIFDEPYCYHQSHKRPQQLNTHDLYLTNMGYFINKWGGLPQETRERLLEILCNE